jgi:hypothetical protein
MQLQTKLTLPSSSAICVFLKIEITSALTSGSFPNARKLELPPILQTHCLTYLRRAFVICQRTIHALARILVLYTRTRDAFMRHTTYFLLHQVRGASWLTSRHRCCGLICMWSGSDGQESYQSLRKTVGTALETDSHLAIRTSSRVLVASRIKAPA